MEHQVDRLAGLLSRVLDSAGIRDRCRVCDRLDTPLFDAHKREAWICPRQVVARLDKKLKRNQAILAAPLNLDARPRACRIPELLALFIDPAVLAAAARTDPYRPALRRRFDKPIADDIADARVIINTTPITSIDVSLLNASHVVLDAVYHPLQTQLLRGALTVGATVVDGLEMLVHQAALQQQFWIGEPGDVGLMRAAALASLEIA